MSNNNPVFTDLPSALVEEMLSVGESLGEKFFQNFNEVYQYRDAIRSKLEKNGWIKHQADLGNLPNPTICGVDGAYAVERLLATDLVACAAVAMEGTSAPENRYWEAPYHKLHINLERHNSDTGSIIRALMMGFELELAVNAPHDVVILDGSLTTPLIYFNQGRSKSDGTDVGKVFNERYADFLSYYKKILESTRTDKNWVGLPKYTTRREIGRKLELPNHFDDRAIMTNILKPGEYTEPIELEKPQSPWHLTNPSGEKIIDELIQDITRSVYRINVIYFKPESWSPALRIEMAPSIATNEYRLAAVLKAIRNEYGTPGILEPYPLYMADRMVKQLGNAMPAIRQAAQKKVIGMHTEDITQIFVNMHSYRSDSGR